MPVKFPIESQSTNHLSKDKVSNHHTDMIMGDDQFFCHTFDLILSTLVEEPQTRLSAISPQVCFNYNDRRGNDKYKSFQEEREVVKDFPLIGYPSR